MPRRKKKPTEWTTEEAMKKLFPKPLRDELYRVAHEKDDPNAKEPESGKGASSQDEFS